MIELSYCPYLFERFFLDTETGKRWYAGDPGIQDVYDVFMKQTDSKSVYWKEQAYGRTTPEHERTV